MVRLKHHSNNYGGRREGSGRKRGGFNRLTKEVIEKALAAPVHPVDFLLSMVANESLSMRERGAAAQSLLPYVATRLSSAEIVVSNEIDGKSDQELRDRLLTVNKQLLELGQHVIDGELSEPGHD
jgi:hypothetical protein